MSALKHANKFLLVALGVAIVLVIAAIIILAITLGKANNLSRNYFYFMPRFHYFYIVHQSGI